ncbi:hypothetical protein HDU96_003869 [Phlyctochytrium bullatum]|nr:hypothetical protein HDU96_003869 [Phlyctochytrium bullatum]
MGLATVDDGSLVWTGQPWRSSALPGPDLSLLVVGIPAGKHFSNGNVCAATGEPKWEADAKNEPAEPGTATLHVTPIMMRTRTAAPSGETKPSSSALFSSTIRATLRAVEAKYADGALFAEAANPFEEAEESGMRTGTRGQGGTGVREWAATTANATMEFGGGVEAWTAEEVSARLRTMGVSAAAVEALRASNVDGQALLVLTPADLPRLGIEPASHAVVMVAVRFLRVLRESGEGVGGTANNARGADVVAAIVDEGDGIAMPPPGYSEA